jgi:hypothetical protein
MGLKPLALSPSSNRQLKQTAMDTNCSIYCLGFNQRLSRLKITVSGNGYQLFYLLPLALANGYLD